MPLSSASQPSFDTWLSSLQRVCGNFDCQPPRCEIPFQGEVDTLNTGGLEVAEIRTNAQRIARRHEGGDREEDRYCFLIVQRQGRVEVRGSGNRLALRPGEMLLADSARDFEILPQGLMEQASFHLPRPLLAERLQHRIPFGKLSPTGPSGQLLQLMVNRIVSRQLAEADRFEGEAVGEALLALLTPLTRDIEYRPSSFEGTELLYHGARQLIDQQLQDPDLSPATLAERLAVSVRQLYRLFEAHDDVTVCRYIQRRRLDCCAEDLANPAQAGFSITEIAFRWGFTDSAHFSRAFKKVHGASPRDYRRHHSLH